MAQVYVDGVQIYDPFLEGYELTKLTATTSLDKAGTAEIVMPAGHPAYNSFTSYRSVISIHRADRLIFRGRVLYPTVSMDKFKTLICEGERNFLRDGILEPYLYQAAPDVIFSDVITRYNAQVEPYKQFQVGVVTATDPNGYVRLESEEAEQVSDVIDKLVERVGGYIIFTTNSAGQRVINWYGALDHECGQVIEFGENLLDYSLTGSNPDLATIIYPYGAKDETTGKRLTIEAVNGGKRYIRDEEAIALRGSIAKPVYWDDVKLARNLLRKAQQYLAASKLIVNTLELTAFDLSVMDRDIDALEVGDIVRVRSAPHCVDDVFLLRERTYDFFDPSQDRVVLGKERATLTGADVIGDKQALAQLRRAEQSLKTDYKISLTDALARAAIK